jgi:hypothetical protein
MDIKIDTLKFEEVSFYHVRKKTSFVFKFKIKNNENKYALSVIKTNGNFHPYKVYHVDDKDCSYCKRDQILHDCDSLSRYTDEIYIKLKEHPSIRLEFIFLQ